MGGCDTVLFADNAPARRAETAAGLEESRSMRARLTKHPRIGASWMNMVEIFFGIISRPAIRRGSLTELIGAIRTFIDGYNERCQPFRWTKTADQILTKANRQKNLDTGH